MLPFTWFIWAGYDPVKRKSWHHVKKGMEKHEHRYTVPDKLGEHTVYGCEHEGCNFVSTEKTIV